MPCFLLYVDISKGRSLNTGSFPTDNQHFHVFSQSNFASKMFVEGNMLEL